MSGHPPENADIVARLQLPLCLSFDHRINDGAAEDVSGVVFDKAVIATGSRPAPLPGIAVDESRRILDSARALALDEIPEKLLVVGGGYIGLELGMVYCALGSQVTLVEMAGQLLPGADSDLVKPLERSVDELFEGVHLNTKVTDLEEDDDGVRVSLEGDASVGDVFDRVLVAAGRQPRLDDLGLEDLDVIVDEAGFIEVDQQRRTELDHIFAVGDVTGGMMLAHEAMREGKVAAEVMAGAPAAFDARAVPAVVYTDPQVAWCGLTEQQAEETDENISVVRFPWQASGRAVSMGIDSGMTKIAADAESGRVLGMGVVGPQAEAMIAEGVLAIEMGARVQDMALTIHPHPTLSETFAEVSERFMREATHYIQRK